MVTLDDLKAFFKRQDYKFIIVSDAETRVHKKEGDSIVETIPAGGVAIALDPIARASGALYIGRGKTEEDKKMVNGGDKVVVQYGDDKYTLKRIFIPEPEFDLYYNGFSNQTLWPLCHVAFEPPDFRDDWYEGYKKVNQRFAQSTRDEIKGKTFIWINDYQLALVPKYLNKPKDTIISLFWHIPWPTWEIFRTLPYKKEILESLLQCDYIAFHRGYQARNFIRTVEREFEVREDQETQRIYYNNHVTTVTSLPMGIDTDIIESLIDKEREDSLVGKIIKVFIKKEEIKEPENKFDHIFERNKVIIGVDRLDYTKGLGLRLQAIDLFLERYPKYIGKITYFGILSPSRETISAYIELKKSVFSRARQINQKYGSKVKGWTPIHLISETFSRKEIVNFYKKADLCLVTPRDDGMNLVSKEYVISTSFSKKPGMLVLSQFAGSAIDLTSALIVNPYNVDEVAEAIKIGLEMPQSEKTKRIHDMVETLEDKNVYVWAEDFIRGGIQAGKDNKR